MNIFELDDSFPNIGLEHQEKIKIPLKPHQLTLIKACRNLEDSTKKPITNIENDLVKELKTKFGIIGDVVGSGKTLTILGLIATKVKIENRLPTAESNGLVNYYETRINEMNVRKNNIIVVPHTIMAQWEETIVKYTTFSYITISNKKTLQKFIDIYDNNEKFQELNHDIILVSSTRIRDFIMLKLKNFDSLNTFSRYIFDEADALKIPSSIYTNSSFVWFVTSSYKTLMNPKGDLYWRNQSGEYSEYYSSQRGFIYSTPRMGGLANPGFIKNMMVTISHLPSFYKKYLVLKNKDSYVQEAFKLEDYLLRTIKCKTPYYLNILGQNVSNSIIQHINAGDIKGAIDSIDCKKFNEKELIQGITHDYEKRLENLQIDYEANQKKTYSTPEAKKESLKKIMGKIISLKNKISSIKEKLTESTMCSICYDEIENTSVAPCCNTKYCFKCISTWLAQNKNCPFCRSTIDFNSLVIVSDTPVKKKVDELQSKIDNLKVIIDRQIGNPEFKMIIFSDYNASFDKIEELLDSYDLNYSNVKGNITRKLECYKKYRGEDKIDILLLNASYCANGINLENTSDIVFYHSMNKDKTTQVIGRGQRPGRKGRLNVWKLCYENEL